MSVQRNHVLNDYANEYSNPAIFRACLTISCCPPRALWVCGYDRLYRSYFSKRFYDWQVQGDYNIFIFTFQTSLGRSLSFH